MKTIYSIIAGLSLLAVAASCQQFDVDTQMSDEEYANHIQLVCDAAQEYNLPAANPQTISFNVSSNAAWTVSGAPEWISVTPASSSASSLISDVTVTAQPNTTDADRSATLVIANDKYDTQSYTVVVNQLRQGGLFVQPIPQSFEGAGNTLAFTIEANYDWKVRTSETWLTVDKTSGEASDQVVTVNATAALNEGVERYATVTVISGPQEKTFDVIQKGISFRIVTPEKAEINSKGGELVVEIDTPLSWSIKGDNDAFTVEPVDATHFKVSAPYNNKFAARSVKVTAESKIGKEEIVISQDINFVLENCEVLSDGSVKLTDSAKSRIYLKGEHRFIEATFTFGEKNFKSNGEAWFCGTLGGVNIYNQITVGGNTRFRTDGNRAAPGNESVYANSKYSLSQDELNKMTSYKIVIAPATDSNVMHLVFEYNGNKLADDTNHLNPFLGIPDMVDDYYFGFYHSASDGSSYVVATGEYKDLDE